MFHSIGFDFWSERRFLRHWATGPPSSFAKSFTPLEELGDPEVGISSNWLCGTTLEWHRAPKVVALSRHWPGAGRVLRALGAGRLREPPQPLEAAATDGGRGAPGGWG